MFIVDNAIIFPDNIKTIDDYVFNNIPEQVNYVYGKNVEYLGEFAFSCNKYLRIARFPNLEEIEDSAF